MLFFYSKPSQQLITIGRFPRRGGPGPRMGIKHGGNILHTPPVQAEHVHVCWLAARQEQVPCHGAAVPCGHARCRAWQPGA